MTTQKKHAIIIYAGVQKALYLGVAQLVACYLGVVEAAGSSPVTQTRENPRSFEAFSELRGFLFFAKSACTTLSTTKKITALSDVIELTVFFYLFLYRRAIYEAKIHTSF